MWPWEHLAIGYLGYISYYWIKTTETPHQPIHLAALAFGTQFPDLVDKPLGWAFGVLPGGTSVAHSLFVAPVLIAAVWIMCVEFDISGVGNAFGIGYLLHLPADILFPIAYRQSPEITNFLWPLFLMEPSQPGFLGNVLFYFTKFQAFLATPRGLAYLIFDFLLIVSAALVFYRMITKGTD